MPGTIVFILLNMTSRTFWNSLLSCVPEDKISIESCHYILVWQIFVNLTKNTFISSECQVVEHISHIFARVRRLVLAQCQRWVGYLCHRLYFKIKLRLFTIVNWYLIITTFEKLLITVTPGSSNQPWMADEMMREAQVKPITTVIIQNSFSAMFSALTQYEKPCIVVASQ